MIDLTETPGNPAYELTQNYQSLMAITDTEELVKAAMSLVAPLIGHGISAVNYYRFVNAIGKAKGRGLVNVQTYLSNYILAAADLAAA